jgi:hypothetical protein
MRYVISKADSIGLDTLFVVLFLAVEYSRAGEFISIDAGMMAVTLMMALVLPYFLPSAERSGTSFTKWIALRGTVLACGLAAGLLLPGSMRYLPMSFLIVAGICSCFVQFYSLMKLRLAD